MASGNISTGLVKPPTMDNTVAHEITNSTFTVPRSGLYRIRYNPSSGNTSRVDIVKDGSIMYRVPAISGQQQYSLIYLDANVTYSSSISDQGQAWIYYTN